jgi:hypothetical protein
MMPHHGVIYRARPVSGGDRFDQIADDVTVVVDGFRLRGGDGVGES